MFETELPYDKQHLRLQLPDANVAGVLEGRQNSFTPTGTPGELVESALDAPIGSPALEDLCRGKRDIVIISSDHTRPVPSRVTMPILLRRIHGAAPEARVRILVATGMHRPSTHEELVAKYGERIVADEEIVMHVATDDGAMVKIGALPSGGECIINRIAAEADLLLAEGFIEPHFFAGFSGSRKSVLPGVASYKTIMYNHNGQFVHDERSRAGVLEGNRVHDDMMAAAEMAGLAFILNVVLDGEHHVIGAFAGDIHAAHEAVNVVLDGDHRIIGAFAGDIRAAHEAGCDFVRGLAGVRAVECDVAITTHGGYPLDQNIYQAVKGMTAAEATLGEGCVIIAVAGSADGHGGEGFFRNIAEHDPAAFERSCIDRPKDQTLPDQWTAQIFARIRLRFCARARRRARRGLRRCHHHQRRLPARPEHLPGRQGHDRRRGDARRRWRHHRGRGLCRRPWWRGLLQEHRGARPRRVRALLHRPSQGPDVARPVDRPDLRAHPRPLRSSS